jgi:hypothetical protein
MWAIVASFFGRIFAALIGRWLVRQDAKQDAQVEMAAEIAEHDRERANKIRDRVDAARLGGGMHPKPDDQRGYRAD